MCLKIKSGPHTAKKAFYTLKVAEHIEAKSCKSYFQTVHQDFGKLLTSELRMESPYYNVIYIGLHSLITSEIDYIRKQIFDYPFDGHCFKAGILLCKIPKGATYYLGQEGDIVSDKLILVEPILVSSLSEIKLENNIGEVKETLTAIHEAAKLMKESNLNIQPS